MLYRDIRTWTNSAVFGPSLIVLAAGLQLSAGSPAGQPFAVEPTADLACSWWPDLRDFWTPVGWKDHLFRFNVFYNGVILAQPDLNRRTTRWGGQGVQLTFLPTPGDSPWAPSFPTRDDGLVRQGWVEKGANGPPTAAAPVLWSEWPQDGFLFRQEVFAHVPGGKPVETGVEPLYAWVRLSIADVVEALPLEKRGGFHIRLNAPHIGTKMAYLQNIKLLTDRSAYPRKLTAEGTATGWRLLEEDGRVRLGVAPGHKADVSFQTGRPTPRDSTIAVLVDLAPGRIADLLVPMLPMERSAFDAELALGFDAALAEVDAYWAIVPATAAVVDTPEPLVNHVLARSLKFAEIISERDPQTGHYSLLSGSFAYADLWTTPFAMNCIMLLDALGYHAVVDRHLELFRREQGTVIPPGEAFKLHPGYLSTPKSLTSIDWLSDHGALLYTICAHALLSGDEGFARRWLPAVEKACDFIKDARAITDHGGVPGILPPAVATDAGTKMQAVWNDGWNYRGLTTAVRLLKRLNHPRAAEFEAEARAYREAWRAAFIRQCADMPTWRDAAGRAHHLAPTALYGGGPADLRHVFYLDTGPLFPVYAGLMDAGEEPMRSTLLWFRAGPPTRSYRPDSATWQVPCLHHEMSSWEPCYSWNVFHSHATGDRHRYLEGMYSLFAGSVSRQTFISCETRGGITGNVFSAPLAAWLARLAMIDDQIAADELHLLRLVPLAWLRSDRATRFERMPTEYGPVTLKVRLGEDGKQLDVTYTPTFRAPPRRVWLHVPPVTGLNSIVLNGKPVEWNGQAESIEIPSGGPNP